MKAKRARAQLRQGLAGEPSAETLAEMGPGGTLWGSAPVAGPTSIAEILDRVQARVAAR